MENSHVQCTAESFSSAILHVNLIVRGHRRSRQARVVSANSLGQIGAASGHKRLLSSKRAVGIASSTNLIGDHLDSDSNTPCVSKICSTTRLIKIVYRVGLRDCGHFCYLFSMACRRLPYMEQGESGTARMWTVAVSFPVIC